MSRLVRWVLAAQCLCAMVVFGDAVIAQKQRPDGQFTRYTEDGNRVHIVPSLDTMSRIPRLTAINDEGVVQGYATVYPSPYGQELLTDHGDPEIPNARVQAVYWNTSVANATATSLGYGTIRDQINGFLNAFSDGVNWRDAATADYTIIQQYGSNATIAASLGNVAPLVDSQTTASTISDAAIRTYLSGRFNAGALTPNASTLYAVFFPPGMTVTAGSDQSCSAFCGYHSWFTYNGTRIIYAAMPYLSCNSCRFVSGGSVADQLTVVLSHEVREAVTDSFNSWYDSSGNEADDKCNTTHLYQMANGGFWVQPEWSNGGTVTRSGFTASYPGPGCVVPGGASTPATPSAPTGVNATAVSVSQITLTWTAVSGATSYVVRRSTLSGSEATIASAVSGTSYTDAGLAAGTRYFYVVAASNGSGTSADSTEVSAVTLGTPGALPNPPTGLTARASSNQISLSWTGSSGAVSYTVKRGTTSGVWTTIAANVGLTSYTDAGLASGTYYYVVAAANGAGASGNSNEASARVSVRARITDYDGDGKSDPAIFRPSTGTWWVLKSSSGFGGGFGYQWGASTDTTMAGDFDGDGITDIAVYRPSTGAWWIRRSSLGFAPGQAQIWGIAGDVPVPGDYDGDGKTDLAVFRPATSQWLIQKSSNGATIVASWGQSTDVPVPADYDGDGITDVAVFRPTSGEWLILKSSTATLAYYLFGGAGDTPVPGDYDGDGVADLAIYRPSTGLWAFLKSSTSFVSFSTYVWGAAGDVPATGDFDGDGKMDLGIFRQSTGEWWILTSSSGYASNVVYRWGTVGDQVIKR